MVNVGDLAPEALFSTADRQEIKLADYRDSRNVVVAFFVADFPTFAAAKAFEGVQ